MTIQLRACSWYETQADPRAQTITTGEQLGQWVRYLSDARVFAADTETSGLRWDRDGRIIGWALGTADAQCYIPFRHQTGEIQLPEDVVTRAVKDLFTANTTRIWWNRKFDEHMARKDGIRLTIDRDIDAMLEARLYDENTSAALKHRALVDLGDVSAHVYEEILGREVERLAKLNTNKKQDYLDLFGYAQIPVHMAGLYACRDAAYTIKLHQKYHREGLGRYMQSARGPGCMSLWHTEQALASVLCDLEEWGFAVDTDYFAWLKQETNAAKERLEAEIWAELGYGKEFNLDSDDKLRDFLVRDRGLALHKTTKGGDLAVDREVLEEFAEEAPILLKIKDRREAAKIATTYTDSLLKWIGHDGLLHCNYQQMQADTGRASSTQPNMTNISSDSDTRAKAAMGKKLAEGGVDPWSVRRGFPVRPGFLRLFCDWSQIELRVVAHITQDPELLAAYRNGEDLHDKTTKLIFGEVDPAKRKVAKMANFGVSFGLTAMGLARRAKIPAEEAEAFMAQFDHAYSGLTSYRHKLWSETRERGGWFENLFGRTRRIPSILSPDDRERTRAERQTIASMVQGTAADISKAAAVSIGLWLRQEGLRTRIVGWIHDEFQFDVPPEELAYVAPQIKARMQHFPDFSVPIIADVEYSTTNWSEKKDLPL